MTHTPRLRPVVRTACVLLLLVGGFTPFLHAAQHDDPEGNCVVCLVGHAGVKALVRHAALLSHTPRVNYVSFSESHGCQHRRDWSPVAGRAPPESSV